MRPPSPLLGALLFLLPLLTALARSGAPLFEPRSLSRTELEGLARADPAPWTSVESGHLGELLVPRPAGSENNKRVREYIKGVFRKLAWHLEEDTFTGDTPIGPVEFTNLIFTFDPDAPRKIVLAAHHDSLWSATSPMDKFVGATDSAAPCAMLIDLAEYITPSLVARRERRDAGQLLDEEEEDVAVETTLQIVFFDGEEAFHSWTDTDSTYGSRHLASKWEEHYLAPTHPLYTHRMMPTPCILNTVSHLVLFDLLGTPDPRILNTYRETEWMFDLMATADERLREAGLVKFDKRKDDWFQAHQQGWKIEDDHVPFNRRGVSVLHIIANPFPSVWHKIGDDASALDLDTMHRWNLIMRVFATEYLALQPAHSSGTRTARDVDELVSKASAVEDGLLSSM